ncbi:MAG: restriction endonuclease [Candidatus Sedimenticola sp. (ex Thyasira tokunagai)]
MPDDLLHFSEYRSIQAKEIIEDPDGERPGSEYAQSNPDARNWNKQHYAGAVGICPFCNVPTEKRIEKDIGGTALETKLILECQNCGWWELERKFESFGIGHDVCYAAIHHQAVAKRFNIKDSNAPTAALIDVLKGKPDVMYGINKKKMEEVVQYVFSSFYACDVEHCGKSHDGGVDLVIIDSDEPTLVQVKCRESKGSVEPISQIRDFLGAMWIKKSRKGIYVTTADHYSNVSVKTINQMISDNTLEKFELIDFKRFVEMLDISKTPKEEIWRSLMNEYFYLAK